MRELVEQTVNVNAEHITVEVGNLRVVLPGGRTNRADITFDGKPPPFQIRNLRLFIHMDDVVRCEMDTFVLS